MTTKTITAFDLHVHVEPPASLSFSITLKGDGFADDYAIDLDTLFENVDPTALGVMAQVISMKASEASTSPNVESPSPPWKADDFRDPHMVLSIARQTILAGGAYHRTCPSCEHRRDTVHPKLRVADSDEMILAVLTYIRDSPSNCHRCYEEQQRAGDFIDRHTAALTEQQLDEHTPKLGSGQDG